MNPAKLGAITAASVVAVGGTGYGVFHWFSGEVVVVLSKTSNFDSTYSEDKHIGKRYGNYLVAPFGGVIEGSKSENRGWWKRAYERWSNDSSVTTTSLSSEFGKDNVKSGYKTEKEKGTNDDKSLNKVCKSVYLKKQDDHLDPKANSTDNKHKLWNDLWKYCSVLEGVPELLNATTDNTTFLKKEEFKHKAVAVTYANSKATDRFWEIRNDEFFGADGKNGLGHGISDSIFATLYGKKSSRNENDTVKNICKEAYEREISKAQEANKPKIKEEEIKKFCYLFPEK
ncbi:hypothetical protein MHSWG343_08110 [Candidatus Mycoplasma haematohominis]|uniref:Uncharacterized protein n=1 Tax=Candidatus Mycoplasma haematohominis TaxID=1494318 RepID=A0A478FRV6_9MOLU|nr:hypothetical protein MHSWG343_08110 [Candidatus Mycoplasma haemohominis]